jgi:hypothetical protein
VLASAVGFNGGRVLWLIGGEDVERFLGILQQHNPFGFQVEAQRDVAVLGIVGEQAGRAPRVMARVAHCLEQTGTHALTALQGASCNSVVLALPDEEQRLKAVLNLLHTELGLDRPL